MDNKNRERKKLLKIVERYRKRTLISLSANKVASLESYLTGKVDSLKSKLSSTSTVKTERYQLQKEEAALKAKLAYAEEEQKLKMKQKRVELMKLEHEENSTLRGSQSPWGIDLYQHQRHIEKKKRDKSGNNGGLP